MVHQISEKSVVQIIDTLLSTAIDRDASDIHLESTKDGLRVRLRIDGILYEEPLIDIALMHQIISRVKVLSNIDIAQKRIPQDGKFQCIKNEICIDLRVSTFPTLFGEKVVIRILDPSITTITINKLGMSSELQSSFMQMITQPQGFFLVTGPTGSGKTTTLYAGLSHINTAQKNIITLEDPIEYHIDGITQGHINSEVGFTFEKGLRALLRQDPDVVMVGEIRDYQTAQIAIQASMTGHLVLSTLHTNDAPSVIMRLMDIGIKPFLINATVSGVLAQRLVRMLCIHCKKQRALTNSEKQLCKSLNKVIDVVYESTGCSHCFNIGCKGRIGIFEMLVVNDELRELINKNPSITMIKECAYRNGMQTLMNDGLDKVAQGVISIDELLRVV